MKLVANANQVANNANLTAHLQDMQNGTSTNVVDNQQIANALNDELTVGTSVNHTNVSLTSDM